MWFIGLIVGGFIGAIGGGAGAVIGALAGAGVGWALANQLDRPGNERLARLEASIEFLQQRVASLERSQRKAGLSETEPTSEYREPTTAEPDRRPSPVTRPVDPRAAPARAPMTAPAPPSSFCFSAWHSCSSTLRSISRFRSR